MAYLTPFCRKFSGKFPVKITFRVPHLSFSGGGWVHKFGTIVPNETVFLDLHLPLDLEHWRTKSNILGQAYLGLHSLSIGLRE